MSTVNSTISNANRVSGLASGMDTEAIIKAMLTPQQGRINKQLQAKQTLQWQQESYRTIIAAATEFQNKYLSKTSLTGIYSKSFFNPTKVSLSSGAEKYVSITAAGGASTGNVVINKITSLATAQKLTSVSEVSEVLTMTLAGTGFDTAGFSGKSFDITVDGVKKTITLSDTSFTDMSEVTDDMQSKLDKAFGGGRVNLTLSTDETKISFGVAKGSTLALTEVSGGALEKLDGMSFVSGKSNRMGVYTQLKDISDFGGNGTVTENGKVQFSINGVNFEFDETATLTDVMNKVNSSAAGVKMTYSSAADKFTLTANTLGAGSNIDVTDQAGGGDLMLRLFGQDTMGGIGQNQEGTNAKFIMNGQEMVRNSNNFTIDGVTFSLLAVTPDDFGDISASVDMDIDQAVENIKGFIDAYNALNTLLLAAVNEKHDKNYTPLTEEQRDQMNDKDIEKWEIEAKKGLLYNDPTINSMLLSLRQAMTSPVYDKDGSLIGLLSQIGIKTAGYFEEGGRDGKIVVDEEKLRKALSEDPAKVTSLFTAETSIAAGTKENPLTDAQKKLRYNQMGLAQRFAEIMESKISTRYMMEGDLVRIAGGGTNAARDKESKVAKSIKLIDDYIARLQAQYDRLESRYYAKFSRMETALSNMNSQSSYLSQFSQQG